MAKKFAAQVQIVQAQKIVEPNAVQVLPAIMGSSASQRTANKVFALRARFARIHLCNQFLQAVKVIHAITL